MDAPSKKTCTILLKVVLAFTAAYIVYCCYKKYDNNRKLQQNINRVHHKLLGAIPKDEFGHPDPFKLTTKQRVDMFIKQQKENAIIAPRNFDFVSSSVSMEQIDEFLLACRYALVAYSTSEVHIQEQCEKMNSKLVGSVNNGNCYAFVARRLTSLGDTQILGIQGTEFIPGDHNLYQVWSDLSIIPQYVGGFGTGAPHDMYVHSGFYDDLAALWTQIEPLLDYSLPIWICAHSLGAVRAVLARFLIPMTTFVRITNFGSPKGANPAFWNYVANNSNTKIERVLAERDFAGDWQPLLPYEHPVEHFYWIHNNTINLVTERDWLNLSFDDHSILNSYIPKLLALSSTPK